MMKEIFLPLVNDVPKSGGGLYISDDGDNDHRCVYKRKML